MLINRYCRSGCGSLRHVGAHAFGQKRGNLGQFVHAQPEIRRPQKPVNLRWVARANYRPGDGRLSRHPGNRHFRPWRSPIRRKVSTNARLQVRRGSLKSGLRVLRQPSSGRLAMRSPAKFPTRSRDGPGTQTDRRNSEIGIAQFFLLHGLSSLSIRRRQCGMLDSGR